MPGSHPLASLHPPRPQPRPRAPPRPSHRPPARLCARLVRLPASPRSVPPEADGDCRRLCAAGLPPALLRLPRTPSRGLEEASSPLGLLPASPLRPMGPRRRGAAPAPWRWRTERAGRGGQGPGAEGGVCSPARRPKAGRCAVRACHVGAPAAAGLQPGRRPDVSSPPPSARTHSPNPPLRPDV